MNESDPNTPQEQMALDYLVDNGFNARFSKKYMKFLGLRYGKDGDLKVNMLIGKYRILGHLGRGEYKVIFKKCLFPFYGHIKL